VYILTNQNATVLYTGVTSDLKRRVYQHKHKIGDGFTARYGIDKLVYYEIFDDIENAIAREKQVRARSRKYKIGLINKANWLWQDLYDGILYSE
jgi:putative endonuclease